MTKCQLEFHHLELNGSKAMPIGITCSEQEVSYSVFNPTTECVTIQYSQ